MKTKLLIATRNAHKVGEIAAILPDCFEIASLNDLPEAPEIEENGATFAANAALKAVGISRLFKGLVLADDSGLCVDALGGAPGIHSARFAGEHGNDAANNALLLEKLAGMPQEAPFSARFVCSLCLAQDGAVLAELEGKVEGQISLEVSGVGGFGYDPLFIPMGYDKSFGELDAQLKNEISHRAKALDALRDYFACRSF